MKCLILAAGYATRLYPLTENFPKPLLEVGKATILDRLIDDIRDLTDEFVIISNHKFADQFRNYADAKIIADFKKQAAAFTGSQEAYLSHFPAVPKAAKTAADGSDDDSENASSKRLHITVLDDGTTSNETRLGAVKDIQFALEELKIDEECLVMAGDNVLDFSLADFVKYAKACGTSCVMCHEENSLKALQKTAVITLDEDGLITSYEEKPQEPKGHHAVPPFYFYRAEDICRIPEALADGCGFDAPGSFAAWLSSKTPMHAYVMPGKRYDIGDLESYRHVQEVFGK